MDEAAAELDRLAARVRRCHEEVEAGRTALSRYALVWWHGVAADRYRDLVEERRATLSALAEELAWLAESVAALASAARAQAGPLRLVREAS